MRTHLILGLLLLSGSLLATAVPVTGRLLTETGETLAYATASVYADTNLVEGTVTGEDGSFILNLEPGTYEFIFEFLGYGKLSERRIINGPTKLGDLILEPDAVTTETIEVRAERTTVSLQLDKKVFNIGQDALARGGTVTEVLDQLPAITVSADGEISLRGDGSVKILIDGRPSALAESGGLASLSAAAIERVEIITNPSSRYEASGSAGIINIILKKDPERGYGGTIGLTGGFPADYRADLNLNYRRGKWKLYGTGGLRYTDYLRRSELTRRQDGEARYARLDQNSREERNDYVWNTYFGFDYQLSERATLTASYSYNSIDNIDDQFVDYRYTDTTGQPTETWKQTASYREPYRYGQFEASLAKDFAQEGRKLTLIFQQNALNETEMNSVLTDQTVPTERNITRYETRNDEMGRNLLLQGDYVHPFSDKATAEFGFRGDRRFIGVDYEVDVLPELNNELSYIERIGAAYAQYAYEGEWIGVQMGLRYEYTEQEVNYPGSPEDDYLRIYPRLFPSLNLSYKFSEATQAQLSFSRRIWRPRQYQINPFPTVADPTRYTVGNPNLLPVISDRVEVNVLTKTDKWSITAAVYAGVVRDFQFYVNERLEDNLFGLETGTIINGPVNLDEEYRLGMDVSLNYRPTEDLNFGLDVNGFAFEQTGFYEGEDLSTSQSVAYASLRIEATLPGELDFTGRFSYQTPYRTVQTFWLSRPTFTGALSRKLGERFTVTGGLRSVGGYRNEVVRPDFRVEGSGTWSRWRGRFTVQYRFGGK
ncbi:TonB-dependent receptor domain-containing protein [Neolewinella antarctica]|uniref:Outer membrane receptor protein involved in Fe transport n=1 Tax=Neolewinella antarctica TaxID=442734 RepID=A0ABX0X964_9BACT|nr:TonB-dependent receptor [Neolewinella antarctica]NJC25800.1 outer membrane receptor protein involved in Fe transport [Neolewinella antarctica]